jgi:hypothetical protein
MASCTAASVSAVPPGCRRGRFQRVVRLARVAIGIDGDLLQQVVGRFQRNLGQRALQQRHDLRHGESAQGVHARAREQRRNHFERRILGGSADQDDVAALHVGQECVLLRFVEAMNLVDEQDGAAAHAAQALGIGHHRFDFLDAAQYRAERNELAPRHDAR